MPNPKSVIVRAKERSLLGNRICTSVRRSPTWGLVPSPEDVRYDIPENQLRRLSGKGKTTRLRTHGIKLRGNRLKLRSADRNAVQFWTVVAASLLEDS